jgi:hypothetical protein
VLRWVARPDSKARKALKSDKPDPDLERFQLSNFPQQKPDPNDLVSGELDY